MSELITESIIIYQTNNDDGSMELSITTQTQPVEGEEITYAALVGQVITELFEEGLIAQRVNTMMGLTGEAAIQLREEPIE